MSLVVSLVVILIPLILQESVWYFGSAKLNSELEIDAKEWNRN